METELVASKNFYLLAVDIYKTLTLDRKHRNSGGKDYLEEKYGEYTKLFENAQIIHSKIKDKLVAIPVLDKKDKDGKDSPVNSLSPTESEIEMSQIINENEMNQIRNELKNITPFAKPNQNSMFMQNSAPPPSPFVSNQGPFIPQNHFNQTMFQQPNQQMMPPPPFMQQNQQMMPFPPFMQRNQQGPPFMQQNQQGPPSMQPNQQGPSFMQQNQQGPPFMQPNQQMLMQQQQPTSPGFITNQDIIRQSLSAQVDENVLQEIDELQLNNEQTNN
jgi:hypothetical protein